MELSGVPSSSHPLSQLLHRQDHALATAKKQFSSFEIPSPSPKKEQVPIAEKSVNFDPLARGLDLGQQKFLVKNGFEAQKIEPPKTATAEKILAKVLEKKAPETKAFEIPNASAPPKTTPPPATYTQNLKSEEAPLDTEAGNQVDVVA